MIYVIQITCFVIAFNHENRKFHFRYVFSYAGRGGFGTKKRLIRFRTSLNTNNLNLDFF